MVTIRDVAKQANVSIATVSRVMNQSEQVNEKTRKHVEKIIKALDYQPNDVARSLFKGTSKMIALFVPDITNPFFPEVARAVEDVTGQYGYTFILCNTDNDIEKEKKYLQTLKQKSVDGIIVVSNAANAAHFKNNKIPMVALDRIANEDNSTITVQNYEGAKQAVQYLKEIGCKKIAHIAGPEKVSNAIERRRGFLSEVEDEAWFSDDYILTGNFNQQDAFQATKALFEKDSKIDGLFVANDLMVVGVLQALKELEIKVPEEVSVIGFDGIQLGEFVSPSITTISQPIYVLGEKAAKLIVNKIENPDQASEHHELKVTLEIRGSTREKRVYNDKKSECLHHWQH